MYKIDTRKLSSVNICLMTALVLVIGSCQQSTENTSNEEWDSLFNGKDLTGWDIKIAGHALNDNYKNTFRVEDSMLRIVYDDYDKFDGRFGHIYTQSPYSSYKLRFQYRFVGKHLPDAPVWGDRNSGIMVHSQSAQSLELKQDFPISLEMQFLADTGKHDRPTGNICTPGTQVHISDSLSLDHCVNSNSKFYNVGDWVSGAVEVYGDSLVRHIIEGDTVLTYTKPIIGGGFVGPGFGWAFGHITDSLPWINKANTPLTEGHIALQAESQSLDFRRIEILNLVGCMDPKAKNYKTYFVRNDPNKCEY
jgi:hypothetical protein